MALEVELETYRNNLSSLSEHEGKFVLIHGNVIAAIVDTLDEAARLGYEQFGLQEAFFVRKIQLVETPLIFPRSIRPCPT